MFANLDSLLDEHDLFIDTHRHHGDNRGPHIIVIDDFYDRPDEIRELALKQDFIQYSPPLPEQVGEAVASEPQFKNINGRMLSTALFTFRGITVRRPLNGYRFNPPDLQKRMENLIGQKIAVNSWEPGGDGWNGAFHLREHGNSPLGSIHHHFHETNTPQRGWSGVCYLSPTPTKGSGTSFWKDISTNKCIATYGETFRRDLVNFERVYEVENIYNRLVLFRENVLHKIEDGFGTGLSSRLTQTFFFHCEEML